MENSSFPVVVDEVPDSMWNQQPQSPLQQQPPVNDGDSGVVAASEVAGLEGSPSDWSFELFLEEELMNVATPADDSNGPAGLGVEPVLVDPVEPQEPAAVTADPVDHNAINMGKESGTQDPEIYQGVNADNGGIILESGTQHPEISQGENAGNGGIILESGTQHPEISQGENAGNGGIILESGTQHPEISQGKNADNGGSKAPTNKSSNGKGRLVQKASDATKLPARSSSTEPSLSDDENTDGKGSKKPDAERAYKRKKSNRESARRSRSKKATHMKDLEDQVTHLRVENSLLLRRLDALNQQYTASAVDNRVLKADMETLRTKVKVAEDAVSRVIGIAPSQLPNHVVTDETWPSSFSSMPFLGSPFQAAFPDSSAVPVIQDSYYTAAPNAAAVVGNGSYMPVMASPPLLQAEGVAVNGSSNTMMTREAAIELIEKRMMSDDTNMPGSSGGGTVPPSRGLDGVADASMGGRY